MVGFGKLYGGLRRSQDFQLGGEGGLKFKKSYPTARTDPENFSGGCIFELGCVLTRYKEVRRLDSEWGVNVSCQRRIQSFFGKGTKL